LYNYLQNNFPGANYHSAYEAGFCGVWIHNQLKALGIDNMVVNPGDIPTTDKELRQKTDPVDSNKIARSLRCMELHPIYIHSQASLKSRSLLRVRASIVKRVSSIKHQIKSELYFNGIHYPDEFADPVKHWSRRFINWLKTEVSLNEYINQEAFDLRMEEYEQRRAQLLKATRTLRALSGSETYDKQIKLIRSVPGIGLITGM
jgi:transposase